jgi:hypothetical protein
VGQACDGTGAGIGCAALLKLWLRAGTDDLNAEQNSQCEHSRQLLSEIRYIPMSERR